MQSTRLEPLWIDPDQTLPGQLTRQLQQKTELFHPGTLGCQSWARHMLPGVIQQLGVQTSPLRKWSNCAEYSRPGRAIRTCLWPGSSAYAGFPMQLSRDFSDLLEAFAKHQVEYLVVGGYATSVYAKPRYTKDLDLWVRASVANGQRITAALDDFGFASLGVGALVTVQFSNPGHLLTSDTKCSLEITALPMHQTNNYFGMNIFQKSCHLIVQESSKN